MANTYLSRTPSSASNRKTWTWSAWVKRSKLSNDNQVLFQARDGSFPEKLQFKSADILEYDHDIAGTDYTVRTAMVFRDTSAWYHIVVAKDTTQATETNRIKIYVNGEQQTLTEFQLGYPPQNYDGAINNNVAHHIGSNNGSEFFDGSMSHVHFCDGQQLAPTVFGETDSTTGEWKIKTSPSFTPGTNGFTVLKDGNTITDQSANSNNFSLAGGTLTKTEDNPSNVFATFNPLNQTTVGTNVYTYGNTDLDSSTNDNEFHGSSTLGMTSGKYYAEFKMKSGQYNTVGITSSPSNDARTNSHVRTSANSYGLYSYNGKLNTSTYGASYTTPNIIGVAVDLDNNKIYFSRNGNWATGSGAWGSTTWASGTGAFTITDPSLTVEGAYFFTIGDADAGSSGKFSANFGNGYQATTAVSSAGTNASGNGIFEYDVPTGFTALSTKGLNL